MLVNIARKQIASGALLALFGCSAGAQKPVLEGALKDPTMRRESFEATLRVLDEHPEYVPEFMDLALKHETALEALLDDTARRLQDDGLARRTANHLAKYPNGLRQTLIAALDRISGEPAALEGAAQAMAARPQVAAIVITQREDAVRSTLRALVVEVSKNSKARQWFLRGMAENSPQLTALIADDPEVMGAFAKAVASVGAAKGKEAVKNAIP
ncbi:MAG TPA: hypothetical protein VJV79_11290 [Polyangiaceae bacterium]|nr:hypothetical protein [Polyangiaceae bacterium]